MALLTHVCYNSVILAHHCFKIGQTAFLMDDFYHAVMWFQRALEKFDSLMEGATAVYEDVKRHIGNTLDYLNFSLYKVRYFHVSNRLFWNEFVFA